MINSVVTATCSSCFPSSCVKGVRDSCRVIHPVFRVGEVFSTVRIPVPLLFLTIISLRISGQMGSLTFLSNENLNYCRTLFLSFVRTLCFATSIRCLLSVAVGCVEPLTTVFTWVASNRSLVFSCLPSVYLGFVKPFATCIRCLLSV